MTVDVQALMSSDLRRLRDLRFAVEEFHYAYCDVLDRGDVEAWPAFFTEDAVYRVIARDNAESGLPLCLMLCEGMGMLKDRAFAIAHTEMYAPRYVQHQVNNIRVVGVTDDHIVAEGNYMVFETLIDEATRLLQIGKYRDRLVIRDGALLLQARDCIYDTLMVPNCVVYPV